MMYRFAAASALLFAACAADVDNVREPAPPPAPLALTTSAPELQAVAPPEPNRYTVYLASDDARAVDAVGQAMERLNGVIGYDAFVWGEGVGNGPASDWAVTIKLDTGLDTGPAVGVTAGAGSWCDMALSPVRGLTRFVVQHELGHCFDLEHEPERTSWLYYAADSRTDVIPQADVEIMRARLLAGW